MMYYFYDNWTFMKAEEVASLNELFAQKCSDLLDFIYNFKPVKAKIKDTVYLIICLYLLI